MTDFVVVVGAGQIGQAIARRVGVGKHLLLADVRPENSTAAAEVLANAGYDVSTAAVDASSRDSVRALVERATGLGDVVGLIQAAGVSPTQASPTTILRGTVRPGPSDRGGLAGRPRLRQRRTGSLSRKLLSFEPGSVPLSSRTAACSRRRSS